MQNKVMSNTDGEDNQPKRQPSFYRSPSNDYEEGYRDGTKELASLREQIDIFKRERFLLMKRIVTLSTQLKQKEDENREVRNDIGRLIQTLIVRHNGTSAIIKIVNELESILQKAKNLSA